MLPYSIDRKRRPNRSAVAWHREKHRRERTATFFVSVGYTGTDRSTMSKPQRSREQVDRGSKIDGSCRCQGSSEGQDGNWFETAGCGGAPRCTAHLRIELSFNVLV